MAMRNWSFKLFECFKAPKACIWSCCLPCGIPCMQAAAAKLLIRGEHSHLKAFFFAICLGCIGTGLNRGEIREQLSIKGRFLEDCLLTWWLPCCSMVQEWREVMKAKGKDEDEFVWRACSDYQQVN